LTNHWWQCRNNSLRLPKCPPLPNNLPPLQLNSQPQPNSLPPKLLPLPNNPRPLNNQLNNRFSLSSLKPQLSLLLKLLSHLRNQLHLNNRHPN